MQLLARGQPPASIRNIDFRSPIRTDFITGKPKGVAFVQADITSQSSIQLAFEEAWPSQVSSLPLTVFHTAAVINSWDRHPSLLHLCTAVNVNGTANVVAASKEAGADIFIVTSSASVAVTDTNFWLPPWKGQPEGYVQVFGEDDQSQPLRKHETYFGNYAASKAIGERLVLLENSKTFRTGSIRPGNGIYGNKQDQTAGTYLARGIVPT